MRYLAVQYAQINGRYFVVKLHNKSAVYFGNYNYIFRIYLSSILDFETT